MRRILFLILLWSVPAFAQEHEHHHTPAPATAGPSATGDFAADRIFDPAAMAVARRQLAREHGGMTASMIAVDRFEFRAGRGRDAYAWEAHAWFGGDINKFVAKTKGEGEFNGAVEHVELQALYSRAITPYLDLQLGLRHDIEPKPSRTYGVLGIEGLAPYWIDTGAALFVSDKGDAFLRLEAAHDMRLTQKLILQPRVELNFDSAELATAELELRLRYQVSPNFAPYIGVSYEPKPRDAARVVFGLRTWF